MGLRLTAEYGDAPSYEMQSESLHRLRCFTARCISPEYGSHYSRIRHIERWSDPVEYNQQTERLLKKYHAKDSAVKFLYQPDNNGRLSPSQCKALLEVIGQNDTNERFGYAEYPDECMTLQQFKELLQQCFEKKKYLIWR